MHLRPGSEGPEEAEPVPRVWQGVHAPDAPRRDDGVGRGCLRRVLQLRTASGFGGSKGMTATAEFREAVLRKCRESADMKERFFSANADVLEDVCRRFASALSEGHQWFVMG